MKKSSAQSSEMSERNEVNVSITYFNGLVDGTTNYQVLFARKDGGLKIGDKVSLNEINSGGRRTGRFLEVKVSSEPTSMGLFNFSILHG